MLVVVLADGRLGDRRRAVHAFRPRRRSTFPPEAFALDARSARRGSARRRCSRCTTTAATTRSATSARRSAIPQRTMPRAIVLSILRRRRALHGDEHVILGMIPWQEAQQTRTIASVFIAADVRRSRAGPHRGLVMTALILFVTASSLYAVILGYSRDPVRGGARRPVLPRVRARASDQALSARVAADDRRADDSVLLLLRSGSS